MIVAALAAALALQPGPADWQAWNRQMNAAPLRNHPLAWAEEGDEGYDCKGFVVLKIRALHDQGVAYDRMQALAVANAVTRVAGSPPGPRTRHMVLQVDDRVLDNLSAWIQHPGDYRVLETITAERVLQMQGAAASTHHDRGD